MAGTKKKSPTEIVAVKAFDKDLRCKGFQFEVGKTYEQAGEIVACENGFHSCENPFDVLNYYDLTDSRFCVVRASGEIARHEGDSKIASAKIEIEAELKLPEFIGRCVTYLLGAAKGDKVQAASGGYSKLAASGYSSQLAASGDCSKLAASGGCSQLAASGGYSKHAASGGYSKLAASGGYSKLAASGGCSQLEIAGAKSAAATVGNGSRIKAAAGTPIAICEYDRDGNPKRFVCGIAGKDCPADTWLIAKGGKLVPA
jgi:hypothetical protein